MQLRLALLGDSIAWGKGAARERDRLASRLAEGLSVRGFDVETTVFAVPGARSSGLAAQVDRALAWRPALAVVVIGANDLTHFVPPDQAAHELATAVRRLRAVRTEVVVAPAPDLSTVPHVPMALRTVVQAAGEYLRQRQTSAVLAEGGRIADPDQRASRAFATDPSLFSPDRFHPSSAGYAVIADSLLPALEEAAQHLTSDDKPAQAGPA
jgi:lysophospholipase L1-like esterase